jgi:Rrf2 family protein
MKTAAERQNAARAATGRAPGAKRGTAGKHGTPPPRGVARARSGERSSLMHVGRRVDYAVRALAYLAGQDRGRVVGRAEIESRQGIPGYFLSKILRALVAAGILESIAGARGGFRLRRAASEISIREVYEVLEGNLCLIDCVLDAEGGCCFASVCTQIEVWRGAQRLLQEYLGGISIAAVADGYGLRPRLNGADCAASQA